LLRALTCQIVPIYDLLPWSQQKFTHEAVNKSLATFVSSGQVIKNGDSFKLKLKVSAVFPTISCHLFFPSHASLPTGTDAGIPRRPGGTRDAHRHNRRPRRRGYGQLCISTAVSGELINAEHNTRLGHQSSNGLFSRRRPGEGQQYTSSPSAYAVSRHFFLADCNLLVLQHNDGREEQEKGLKSGGTKAGGAFGSGR
jgi:hypothetical protein